MISRRRIDIQIYRAVSVLLVFFFHAGFGFPNGYLGVDIFFVISGFVITGLLAKLRNSERPFREFYIGRLRRITPATSVLILTVSLFIFVFHATSPITGFLKTGIFSIFSIGNIEIAHQVTDYFQPESINNPFLHLWSLGIEEQFYLLIPIILLAAYRQNFNRKTINFLLIIITGVSAAIEIATIFIHDLSGKSIVGYYSPITRAWEFMLGILAFELYPNIHRLQQNSKIKSWIAISIIILVSVISVPAQAQFPIKVLILLSVTYLLINETNFAENKIKSILVWLGDRSFSIYLWHWPTILLVRQLIENQVLMVFLGLLLSIALANLSYIFIENPIRRYQVFRKTSLVAIIFLMIPSLVLTSLYKSETSILMRLESPTIKATNRGDVGQYFFHQYIYRNFDDCQQLEFITQIPKFNGKPQCAINDRNLPISIVLLGDSHSEHLFIGLANLFSNVGVQYIDTGGLPILNSETNNRVMKYVQDLSSIKIVILSAFWSNRGVSPAIEETIKLLKNSGIKVVIIGENPEFSLNPSECKFADPGKIRELCTESLPLNTQEKVANEKLQKIAKQNDINLIPVRKFFCSVENACSLVSAKKLLYRDGNHLSINGSEFVANHLLKSLPLEVLSLS
jgi:peptidoglycan/LPS O-acetylase OafA/YrhL